jgi:hypothetical protein
MDYPRSNFYCDSKPPFRDRSGSSTAMTTALVAYVPTSDIPLFPPNYFWAGKLVYIKHIFQTSSFATPTAFFVNLIFGNNVSNTGTGLCSAGITWTANQSTVQCSCDFWIRCRTANGPGTIGTLFSYGVVWLGGTGLIPIPATGGLSAVSFDTSVGGYIAPQYYRSGSTAEVLTHHDIFTRAMN